MIPLAFHGGTALRLLKALPRHCEDLDFTLEGHLDAYHLRRHTQAVGREFRRQGCELETRVSEERASRTHGADLEALTLLRQSPSDCTETFYH